MGGPKLKRLALVVAAIAAAILPFTLADYMVFRFTLALIWSIAILGMVLLVGVSGQISFGHSAFYGVGGYVAAIVSTKAGLPVYWALPLAALLCFAFGYGFGRVAARLGLWYVAMATFGLAIAFPQWLKSGYLAPLTGGVQGYYLDLQGAPAFLPLSADQWWYLLSLAILLGGMALLANLIDSRTGRAMKAARDHDLAAAASGVNVAHARALAFAWSAAFVGVAGCLAAIQLNFVAPGTYTFWLSVQFLIGLVIGGINAIAGAVIGGLFLQFFPDLTAAIGKRLSLPLFGVLLILVVTLMPNGLAGLPGHLWRRFKGEGNART
ncbi:MAG: branched-chain amino acid ABC transporter permease [Reyranellaceae bacterium]